VAAFSFGRDFFRSCFLAFFLLYISCLGRGYLHLGLSTRAWKTLRGFPHYVLIGVSKERSVENGAAFSAGSSPRGIPSPQPSPVGRGGGLVWAGGYVRVGWTTAQPCPRVRGGHRWKTLRGFPRYGCDLGRALTPALSRRERAGWCEREAACG